VKGSVVSGLLMGADLGNMSFVLFSSMCILIYIYYYVMQR
jgi:hypothetical protein